jgi:hypothetical protein
LRLASTHSTFDSLDVIVVRGVCRIYGRYPTFAYLAGVSGTDDPPVPPLPIDPGNPTKDIYGNRSFPAVDGVNLWSVHPAWLRFRHF